MIEGLIAGGLTGLLAGHVSIVHGLLVFWSFGVRGKLGIFSNRRRFYVVLSVIAPVLWIVVGLCWGVLFWAFEAADTPTLFAVPNLFYTVTAFGFFAFMLGPIIVLTPVLIRSAAFQAGTGALAFGLLLPNLVLAQG